MEGVKEFYVNDREEAFHRGVHERAYFFSWDKMVENMEELF